MTVQINNNRTITCTDATVEEVLNLIYTDALTRERDLKAANESIIDHALPEGMRLADHEEYGRVVVSPEMFGDGHYKVFAIDESIRSKASSGYARPSELTFLDQESAPAPLPKPEDCKAGELYLATRVLLGMEDEVVAVRSEPDSDYPWEVSDECGTIWYADSEITLLSRLLPDR